MDICWSIHQRWVKTLGNMMWQWTSEGTHTSNRGGDINACWHQQIVNLKVDMATHQTGSQLARPNKEGGVKQVSTPPCQEEGQACICLPDVEYSHPHEEGPSPPVEGWLHTLHWRHWKTEINKETRIDIQSMRTCLPKGGWLDKAQGITQVTGWKSPQIITPTKFWTAIDSIVIFNNKGQWWTVLLSYFLFT